MIYVLPISVYYVPTLQYKNWDEQLEWGEIRLKFSSILLDSHFRTHQLNGCENIPFSDQKAHWFYSDLRKIENPSLPSKVTNPFFFPGLFPTELSNLCIRISPPAASKTKSSLISTALQEKKEKKNVEILISSQ
jgi:hypothetical protein